MRKCPDCHGKLNHTQQYCPYCSGDLFRKEKKYRQGDAWKKFNRFLDAVIH